MLSINTNLSNLITQRSMKSATNLLNQAVERMTTGYKVNHAKDNAAAYSIITNMNTKINSLMVAEDNVAQGIDLITTAESNLEILENRVQRLRDLQEQASNGTYGEQSLRAINSECNSLVDEINRLYETCRYNGINLFLAPTTLPDGRVVVAKESDAELDTTFKELGITSKHFEIYDTDDNLVQAYDLEEDDAIEDFFATLQTHGFRTNLKNGEITLSSPTGLYIAGDLADELGITTTRQTFISQTEQSGTIEIETTSANVSSTTAYTTTTSETTQTNTIWITNTIEQTSVKDVETVATTQVAQTDTLTIVSTPTVWYESHYNIDYLTPLSSVEDSLTESRYKIETVDDLVRLAQLVNYGVDTKGVEFILTNDIDLGDYCDAEIANGGCGWTPISSITAWSVEFAGVFDGNGHVIKNLKITGAGDFQGLFGSVAADAEIKNVGLENVSITGSSYVGGLVGSSDALISNCYVTGSVNGDVQVGGLVGYTNGGVSNCYMTGIVTGTTEVGGLVGSSGYYVFNSFAEATVTGTTNVGGLVGWTAKSVGDCYAICTVSGDSRVGGLVGWHTAVYYTVFVDGSTATQTDSYVAQMTEAQIRSIYTPEAMGFTGANGWKVEDGRPVFTRQYVTTISADTTLGELGFSSSHVYFSDNTQLGVDFGASNKISDLISQINASGKGITAELVDGIITLTAINNITIDTTTGADNIFSVLPLTQNSYTNTTIQSITETIMVEQVTETFNTITITLTTTTSTTQTSTVWVTSTVSATGGTTFEQAGLNRGLNVTIMSDGSQTVLKMRKDETFGELYNQLQSKGINIAENMNTITFIGQGDTYIKSNELSNLLLFSALNKTEAERTVNTESNSQKYNEIFENIYAPGKVNLQIGTGSDPHSQIEVDVSFKLSGVNSFRNIGLDKTTDYLTQLDDVLTQIRDKQVHLGAASNRLESALDEISTQYENLVSTRSTLRDADVAEETSVYIQQQILQQASATLMATANQTPSIALQLI